MKTRSLIAVIDVPADYFTGEDGLNDFATALGVRLPEAADITAYDNFPDLAHDVRAGHLNLKPETQEES